MVSTSNLESSQHPVPFLGATTRIDPQSGDSQQLTVKCTCENPCVYSILVCWWVHCCMMISAKIKGVTCNEYEAAGSGWIVLNEPVPGSPMNIIAYLRTSLRIFARGILNLQRAGQIPMNEHFKEESPAKLAPTELADHSWNQCTEPGFATDNPPNCHLLIKIVIFPIIHGCYHTSLTVIIHFWPFIDHFEPIFTPPNPWLTTQPLADDSILGERLNPGLTTCLQGRVDRVRPASAKLTLRTTSPHIDLAQKLRAQRGAANHRSWWFNHHS